MTRFLDEIRGKAQLAHLSRRAFGGRHPLERPCTKHDSLSGGTTQTFPSIGLLQRAIDRRTSHRGDTAMRTWAKGDFHYHGVCSHTGAALLWSSKARGIYSAGSADQQTLDCRSPSFPYHDTREIGIALSRSVRRSYGRGKLGLISSSQIRCTEANGEMSLHRCTIN